MSAVAYNDGRAIRVRRWKAALGTAHRWGVTGGAPALKEESGQRGRAAGRVQRQMTAKTGILVGEKKYCLYFHRVKQYKFFRP